MKSTVRLRPLLAVPRETQASLDVVASRDLVEHVRQRGGATYVWPVKRRGCCGGAVELRASTTAPDRLFRAYRSDELTLFLAIAIPKPDALHLELDRRGRIRAFWNGLGWVQ